MSAAIKHLVFLIGSAASKAVSLVFLLCLTSACTNKAIYQSIQQNAQLKCQNVPPQDYQKCMDQHAQSYESYKRSRDEILHGDD